MPLLFMRFRCLASLLTLAVVAIGVYALVGNPMDPFDNRSFSAIAWRSADENGRARMARDLVKHHLPRGMSEAQMIALLGKPHPINPANRNNPVVAARCDGYRIASLDLDMDDTFVYVYLDEQDRVIHAEIDGY